MYVQYDQTTVQLQSDKRLFLSLLINITAAHTVTVFDSTCHPHRICLARIASLGQFITTGVWRHVYHAQWHRRDSCFPNPLPHRAGLWVIPLSTCKSDITASNAFYWHKMLQNHDGCMVQTFKCILLGCVSMHTYAYPHPHPHPEKVSVSIKLCRPVSVHPHTDLQSIRQRMHCFMQRFICKICVCGCIQHMYVPGKNLQIVPTVKIRCGVHTAKQAITSF